MIHNDGVASMTHEELLNANGAVVIRPRAIVEGVLAIECCAPTERVVNVELKNFEAVATDDQPLELGEIKVSPPGQAPPLKQEQ